MPAVANQEKCTGCEACVEGCPAEAISMNDGGKAQVDASLCTDCSVCVDECPVEAISLAD